MNRQENSIFRELRLNTIKSQRPPVNRDIDIHQGNWGQLACPTCLYISWIILVTLRVKDVFDSIENEKNNAII